MAAAHRQRADHDSVALTETQKRSESTLGGKLTLGFDMTRWLALELAYGAEERSSNFDTFDYTVTRASLSATAAF